MMNNSFLLAALALMLVATSEAFSSAFVGRQQQQHRLVSSRTSSLQMAVVDIDSESAFDDKIKSAGKSLVVVDYSTTWCGPVSQEKEITHLEELYSARFSRPC
jgi:thiol:disulfide interchange protein